jgi:hypothetical protein
MARDRQEQRFLDFTRFVLPGREVGQEVSIPRKARRLDAVFHVHEPPGLFGPLCLWLRNRAVVFEHESGAIPGVALHRALVGHSWVAWRRPVMSAGESRWGTPSEGDSWLRSTEQAPTVLVVADQVRPQATIEFPHVAERWPGVWCSQNPAHGGLIVLDISRMPEQKGWSYWRLTSRGITPEERERRVEALRTDRVLPKHERLALTQAIAMRTVPTTPEEKNVALKSLRKEAFRLGEAEGRRRELLELVSNVAPDALQRLERIEALPTLRREVAQLMRERRS